MTYMDENGEILQLHASMNNVRLFILPFYMTSLFTFSAILPECHVPVVFDYDE